MTSSTSSFESRRWAAYVATTLAVVAVVIFARPADVSLGVVGEHFWLQKLAWGPAWDVVFAGDSRTSRAIAPSEISPVLDGARVANFGFGGAGWSTTYLDRLPSLLAADAATPTVVLGITPFSLTEFSAEDNQFEQHRRTGLARAALGRWLGPLLHRLRPLDPQRLRIAVSGDASAYRERRHLDGWAATLEAPDTRPEGLQLYRELFSAHQVSERIVVAVLDRVRRWTARGIRVAAFRPPTTPEMVALEDRASGFNEVDFRARFKAAGGTWLAVPTDPTWKTYDASHLRAESARAFSAAVATELNRTRLSRVGPTSAPSAETP